MRNRLRLLLAAALLVGATACSAPPPPPRPVPPTPVPSAPPATEDGPVLTPELTSGPRSAVAIDYVDFVNHDGRRYHADPRVSVGPAELGEVVLRSRCSLSAFNDRTLRDPGASRDGDTGFLPPGTEIRAVRGWPVECRLAAELDGRLHVYVARDEAGRPETGCPRG